MHERMNKLNKIKYIFHPRKTLIMLSNKYSFKKVNDKKYIQMKYYLTMNKKLNLEEPKTFNEKLQWLKLYDRNPEYTKMVDKYEAKKYVADIIGQEYIIPTLGVWDKFEDIDFDILPNQFVLKPTHTSGDIFICKDKEKINHKKLKKMVNKWLKRNYYFIHREWPYKYIKPRIIAEKYMETNEQKELIDYKFFCFNGNPKVILVCSERFSSDNMCETWFDENWNFLDIIESNHRVNKKIKKPINFSKMMEFSKKLSRDIPFIRVDFYEINGKIYFGELTFFPAAGFEKFEPEEWDKKLGDMLELPKEKKIER